MHKQKGLNVRRVLHFNRWSRSAAAAFHSVGNVVNIGQLRTNVLERIAPKSSATLRLLNASWLELWEQKEAEESGADPWEESLLSLITVVATTDTIAARPS